MQRSRHRRDYIPGLKRGFKVDHHVGATNLEDSMRRLLLTCLVMSLGAPLHGQAPPSGVTVFEGARVIVGDGRAPVENATIVVDGTRFVQVGRAADVRVPAGATRVSLAGKTVMPAIVDTHVHTSQTRDGLISDLRRRAYYGVSAAMSLGQDDGEAPFEIRAQTLPGAARFFTAGRGSPCRSRGVPPHLTG